MGDGLFPVLAPQQPVRPYWMGQGQDNLHWELVQGDSLAYFMQLYCNCPLVPDITDWIFVFTIKPSLDPSDPNALAQVIWNAQHGACATTALIMMPYFSAGVPVGRWAFDVKYRTPGGMVRTVGRGEIDILPGSDLSLSGEYVIPAPIPGPLTASVSPAAAAGSRLAAAARASAIQNANARLAS